MWTSRCASTSGGSPGSAQVEPAIVRAKTAGRRARAVRLKLTIIFNNSDTSGAPARIKRICARKTGLGPRELVDRRVRAAIDLVVGEERRRAQADRLVARV